MHRRLRPFLLALLAAGVTACPSIGGGEPPERPMSQMEARSFQTRAYETEDTRLVMKALINALQDMGLIIKTADADLGLLTAEKWTNVPHTKKEIRKAQKKELALASSVVLECTANVSPFGNSTRVRIVFQQKTLDGAGAVLQANMIQDPGFYQDFFSRVSKSVFLQQEGV